MIFVCRHSLSPLTVIDRLRYFVVALSVFFSLYPINENMHSFLNGIEKDLSAEKLFQEYHQSVKQFGSRSGLDEEERAGCFADV